MGLLTISNIFMTIAWYEHLKHKDSPLCVVGLCDVGKRVTGVYRHQALVAQLAGSNIR